MRKGTEWCGKRDRTATSYFFKESSWSNPLSHDGKNNDEDDDDDDDDDVEDDDDDNKVMMEMFSILFSH